jgi:oligopeptide transport system substrate-binding protein
LSITRVFVNTRKRVEIRESLISPKGEIIMKLKKILAVMMAGAMMLSMAACGGEETTTAESTGEQKTIDGNVLDAEQYFNGYLNSEPTTLDSVTGNDSYSSSILTNSMEPLTRLAEKDGENVREGAAAESWESNEDGTVWTFHLRDNKWSDGQPVTANDYVYAITRVLTPETGSPNSWLLTCVKNANAVLAGEMDPSELGVKAVDDKTIEFTLESPTPYFLALTDTRVMMPQRQDIVEQYGESYGAEASNMVYNGPFKLETWTHNSELILVKNDQYWDAENVNLQTINYKIMNDENTIFNSFTNGSIDSCGCGTPEWMQKFEAMENVDYIHYTSPAVRFNFYNTKDELFQNANIRNAFTLALDREDIVEFGNRGFDFELFETIEIVGTVGANSTGDDGVAAEQLKRVGDVGGASAVVTRHRVGDKGEIDVVETFSYEVIAEASAIGKNVVVSDRAADHDAHDEPRNF